VIGTLTDVYSLSNAVMGTFLDGNIKLGDHWVQKFGLISSISDLINDCVDFGSSLWVI